MKTEAKKTPRKNYKKIAKALGSRVVWALKFLRTSSGGGFVASLNDPGAKMQCWEDYFMDALDDLGYVVDRKSYFVNKAKKRGGR